MTRVLLTPTQAGFVLSTKWNIARIDNETHEFHQENWVESEELIFPLSGSKEATRS